MKSKKYIEMFIRNKMTNKYKFAISNYRTIQSKIYNEYIIYIVYYVYKIISHNNLDTVENKERNVQYE
ncbi:hypothetical protein BN1318_390016 [Staphylococcus capitis]|nr:hypothetical protein BN1318_390016 [Staphylococcus capitis]